MTQVNYLPVVKDQLWDYLKRMSEYASRLVEERPAFNVVTGEVGVFLYVPSGLEHEIEFTRDEIDFWMNYERGLEEEKPRNE